MGVKNNHACGHDDVDEHNAYLDAPPWHVVCAHAHIGQNYARSDAWLHVGRDPHDFDGRPAQTAAQAILPRVSK